MTNEYIDPVLFADEINESMENKPGYIGQDDTHYHFKDKDGKTFKWRKESPKKPRKAPHQWQIRGTWEERQNKRRIRQDVVHHHFVNKGMSTEDIAKKFGISHQVVKTDLADRGVTHTKHKEKTRNEETYMSEEILDEATRKHFRAAAETIKAIEDPDKRREHAAIHADIYAKQNPRFDRAKFMKAAGVNEDTEIEDDEIEDEASITPAEAIVDAAVFDTPVDLKDTFTQTIMDRIASRVAEIKDEKRSQIFAKKADA